MLKEWKQEDEKKIYIDIEANDGDDMGAVKEERGENERKACRGKKYTFMKKVKTWKAQKQEKEVNNGREVEYYGENKITTSYLVKYWKFPSAVRI